LDRTVAYPAGGGQPSDTGRIVSGGDGAGVTFTIRDVKVVDGVVRHLGVW
jgi:Ser-tRNA(Ala) deacylase AlaX